MRYTAYECDACGLIKPAEKKLRKSHYGGSWVDYVQPEGWVSLSVPGKRGHVCSEECVETFAEGAVARAILLKAFKGTIGCGNPVKVDFGGGQTGTVTARCMTDSLLKCPKCQALLDLARVTPGSPQLLGVSAKTINAKKVTT